MRQIRITLLLFTLLVFTGQEKSNAQSFDTAYANILQNALNNIKSSNSLVGISVAAFIPGQGMWLGTSGISAVGQDMTTEMVFGQGSITKNFISAAILQLCEADSLSLDDSLHKWLPSYNNIDSTVTIRQLLSHRSGIHSFTENNSFLSQLQVNWNRLWTPEEVLPYVLTPHFAPGTSFRYSNTNYTLLGMILTQITGNTLSEEMHRRFYIPLGLNESYVETQDSITAPFAHNWVDMGSNGTLDDIFHIPRTSVYSAMLAPGGFVSRPENLARWMQALFQGQVLDSSYLNQMLTFGAANIAGANGYGLGVKRYVFSGRTCWGHGGNIFGYSSVMMYYPQDSIVMVLMTNRDIEASAMGKSFMNTIINNNPVGITGITQELPSGFNLYQNYPNPFNPSTNIKFDIPKKSFVKLSVYNALGQQMAILVNSSLEAGSITYEWNSENFPSGVYFYKLQSENFSSIKKMMLIK